MKNQWFLHEVTAANSLNLKLTLMSFLGKILLWGFLAKRSRNGPKIWFFNFCMKNMTLRIFLIFYMKLQQHKDLKLKYIIFWGINLFFKFWGQKEPKIGPKWGFPVLSKINAWIFCDFLQEVTAAWKLKIDGNDFLGNYSFSKFLSQKDPSDPKWGFAGIIKYQRMELFWHFAWRHNSI